MTADVEIQAGDGPVATRGHEGHAVVVGAGVSGLCAAHALSRVHGQVSVLDPRPPGVRGVAETELTLLPARARRELEWLMPGSNAHLLADGAVVLEPAGGDLAAAPDHECEFTHALQLPSHVLIRVLEATLAARPNVSVLHGTRVRALRFGPGCFSRVDGVEVVRSSTQHDLQNLQNRDPFDLDAQLVVDATGPGSHITPSRGDEPADDSSLAIEVQPARWAVRRLFERGPALPDGFAPVGSTAFAVPREIALRVLISALSARALEETLAVGEPSAPGFTDRFLQTQSTCHGEVWQWLVGRTDTAHPAPMFDRDGTRDGYLRALRRAALHDAELRELLHRSDQLLDPVDALFQPSVVWRVLRVNRGSRARRVETSKKFVDSA